jgi:hypothetical protein
MQRIRAKRVSLILVFDGDDYIGFDAIDIAFML